ncbi:hypothetical protein HDU67_003141 [Dinochytrium kinnereticum]|nr:hypothetical protein HDU67_003141 [Dinochytrium kinnereticum]
MDLTIWRSTTTNRLGSNDADQNDGHNSPLLTVLRLFLSVFTILSFAMATSPSVKRGTGVGDGDGVPMDMTINLTVVGGLHWGDTRTKLVEDPNWKRPVDASSGNNGAAPVSVLAVPALFGPVIKTKFKAPLLILDTIDACDPFTIILPDVDGASDQSGGMSTPDTSIGRSNSSSEVTPSATTTRMNATSSLNGNSTSSLPPQNETTLQRRGGSPPDSTEDFSDDAAFLIQPDTKRSKWFALIPRGNCPFDIKIYHAQQAGFSGVIIYNNGSYSAGSPDVPVRMSPNTVGDRISWTSAMYMTSFDGKKLIRAATNHAGHPFLSPLLISVAPDSWPTAGWGTGSEGLSNLGRSIAALITDMIFLTISVFVIGIAFTSFYLVVSMVRNYMIHGSMFVVIMHYAQAGADADVGERDAVMDEERFLEKVTLPLRIVSEEDLVSNEDKRDLEAGGEKADEFGMAPGGSRECCAICIDEFVVGSRVRQLPCKHQFHDLW